MSQGRTSGLLLALLAGFAGAGLWEYASEKVSAQSSVSKVVQTERLDIVNAAGETVAQFGAAGNGAVLRIGNGEKYVQLMETMFFIGNGENESAYLAPAKLDGPGPINLFLTSGERRAILRADASLLLKDGDNGSAFLSAGPGDETGLLLKSSQKVVRRIVP